MLKSKSKRKCGRVSFGYFLGLEKDRDIFVWAEFFDRCSFKNEEWREKVLGRREKTEDGGGGSCVVAFVGK